MRVFSLCAFWKTAVSNTTRSRTKPFQPDEPRLLADKQGSFARNQGRNSHRLRAAFSAGVTYPHHPRYRPLRPPARGHREGRRWRQRVAAIPEHH